MRLHPENPQETGTSATHPPPPRCQNLCGLLPTRQAASGCQFQVKSLPHRHLVSYDRSRLGLATTLSTGLCPLESVLFHGTRPGWIELIAGVMFSGKSEELVRRVRRAVIAKKRVQVFKSHLDARYAGLYTVSTHDGGLVDAEPVDSSEAVLRALRPDTEVVTSCRRSAWCAAGRPAAISVSSTASRRYGKAPRSWSGDGSRTRRDAGTATECRGRMRTKLRCSRCGVRSAECGIDARLSTPHSAFRIPHLFPC